MTVDCITIATNHLFSGNPLAEQFRLRYRAIIQRQNWDVPQINDMEYDQYDNPATIYLVWRDHNNIARGMARLYPTDRPFMLKESFAHAVSYMQIPTGEKTLDGSRFCIDNVLDKEQRQNIAREIVLSLAEYAVDAGITQILGLMYPVYWQNLFSKNGWEPQWLGDVVLVDERKCRAAILPNSPEILGNIRTAMRINSPIINYGNKGRQHVEAA